MSRQFVLILLLLDGTRYYSLTSVSLNSLVRIDCEAQQEPALRYFGEDNPDVNNNFLVKILKR